MQDVPVLDSAFVQWSFAAWTDSVPEVVVIDTTPTVVATLYRPRIIPVNFAGRNLDLGILASHIAYCTQEPRSRICHYLTVRDLVQLRRVYIVWAGCIYIARPLSDEPFPEPELSDDIVVFIH